MNKPAEFNFSYKVMTYINVFCSDVKLRVLNQSNSFLIVHLNYNCSESL
jgi:hypothetical protein